MEARPAPSLQQPLPPQREEHPRKGTQTDQKGQKGQLTSLSALSCAQCRSRKLKCDRTRPRCDRCVERNDGCTYPEARQRVLGARKTVRDLEERIEELEARLRAANLGTATPATGQGPPFVEPTGSPPPSMAPSVSTGQLVDLGLFEQTPSFELMDALTTLYFRAIHPGAPMLHQARYMASLRLPPHMRPPMCLQYIVMASAAAVSPAYRHLSEPFYQRARVYAEADELKGQGEVYTTVAHVQAWLLISAYECHVYAVFTRASTSHCRAVRIAQMLKLHQLDNPQHDLSPSLPPPRDAIEAEERRRTWWVVFMADRFLSSTTGWPSLVDERHVHTNLPTTEEAFASGTENNHKTQLSASLRRLEQGRSNELSSFALRLLAANELLHALDHIASSPNPQDAGDGHINTNSSYWRRHREIDTNLTTLTFFLPEPQMNPSVNPRSIDAITVNICVSMAVLHLGRASSPLPPNRSTGSEAWKEWKEARLLPAAESVASVFRAAQAANFLGTAIRNPLLPFAAYMAASVFLQECLSSAAAAAPHGQTQSQRQSSEENLVYLADTLVLFAGKESPVVRANALQLAGDLQKAGMGSAWIDRLLFVVDPATWNIGGVEKEIVACREPMLFCPAVSSVNNTGGRERSTGGREGEGNNSQFVGLGSGYDDSSWAMGFSELTGASVLHAGEPSGLFSQLGPMGSEGLWS